jgi:hypothetical protein
MLVTPATLHQVDPVDHSIELGTLATAAQSFTKADGQVLKMMLLHPVSLLPDKVYMLSALIKGNESYCCEECLDVVIAGGVRVSHVYRKSEECDRLIDLFGPCSINQASSVLGLCFISMLGVLRMYQILA